MAHRKPDRIDEMRIEMILYQHSSFKFKNYGSMPHKVMENSANTKYKIHEVAAERV